MPATITEFFTFAPGTKARSSEVNTNFSNFRGTIVPINTNTASSSDLTHDLGATDHRWNVGYLGSVNLSGMTTTTNITFVGRTDLTIGGAELKNGSATLTNFDIGGIGFAGLTTTQYTKFKYQAGVAAGALDLLMGSSTLGTWTTDGLRHRTKAPLEWTTTASAVGTSLFVANTIASFACTSGALTLGTYRFTAKGSGVIVVRLVSSEFMISTNTTTAANIGVPLRLYKGATTTALTIAASWVFHAQGGIALTAPAYIISGTVNIVNGTTIPYPLLEFHDTSVAAGEIVYEWRAIGVTGFPTNSTPRFYVMGGSVFIQEL